MPRGGKRPGAGRPKGSYRRRSTAELRQAMADAYAAGRLQEAAELARQVLRRGNRNESKKNQTGGPAGMLKRAPP